VGGAAPRLRGRVEASRVGQRQFHETVILFVANLRDVVELYLDPPEGALVPCVDEKTQIQALNRTQPVFPMLPGIPARASHVYVRHGTLSLCHTGSDERQGHRLVGTQALRRRVPWRSLKKFDAEVPPTWTYTSSWTHLHHEPPAVKRWGTNHPRFVMRFTPTSSSWPNLIERWFATLTTKKLRRGANRRSSIPTLVRCVNAAVTCAASTSIAASGSGSGRTRRRMG
jgi:hypothetical protein